MCSVHAVSFDEITKYSPLVGRGGAVGGSEGEWALSAKSLEDFAEIY